MQHVAQEIITSSNPNTKRWRVRMAKEQAMFRFSFAVKKNTLITFREANWKCIFSYSFERPFRPVWQVRRHLVTRRYDQWYDSQETRGGRPAAHTTGEALRYCVRFPSVGLKGVSGVDNGVSSLVYEKVQTFIFGGKRLNNLEELRSNSCSKLNNLSRKKEDELCATLVEITREREKRGAQLMLESFTYSSHELIIMR